MIINAHVVTNAKKESIKYKNNKLVIRTPKPPVKGKANKRIIKLLKSKLGSKVEIVGGSLSRNKRIFVEGNKKTIEKKLENLKD